MAVTDFADAAAAVTAGYKKTQIDRRASVNPRYATQLDKPVSGAGLDRPRFGGHGVTRLLSLRSSFSSSRIRRVTGSQALSGA
jgi:hypothetical protein